VRILFVHAAPREGEALGDPTCARLELGVGKSLAASRLARALAPVEGRPDVVLAFGLAGAYPGRHLADDVRALALYDVCVVERSSFADEGVETPDGFATLADMRLGDTGPFVADPLLSERLATALACPRVHAATVSTIAGVEALSLAYATRTCASVETMESAALAQVCRELGVRFVELRVISNYTGDRSRSGWDLDGSLACLRVQIERVLASDVLTRR
jgi:futalosine hydrolase